MAHVCGLLCFSLSCSLPNEHERLFQFVLGAPKWAGKKAKDNKIIQSLFYANENEKLFSVVRV
jgi:hypothetical protein